jgi:hypothetical protein
LTEDLIYFFIPFFLGVLFVEDAIRLILQTNTAKTERAIFYMITIEDIGTRINLGTAV